MPSHSASHPGRWLGRAPSVADRVVKLLCRSLDFVMAPVAGSDAAVRQAGKACRRGKENCVVGESGLRVTTDAHREATSTLLKVRYIRTAGTIFHGGRPGWLARALEHKSETAEWKGNSTCRRGLGASAHTVLEAPIPGESRSFPAAAHMDPPTFGRWQFGELRARPLGGAGAAAPGGGQLSSRWTHGWHSRCGRAASGHHGQPQSTRTDGHVSRARHHGAELQKAGRYLVDVLAVTQLPQTPMAR